MSERMKTIVISQPMLMPWRGIFEQIRLCDAFVFYDDVQLPLGGGKGRGFITRVQIKSGDGIRWLTLPIRRSHQGKQLIVDAVFADQGWRQQHKESIRQCYRHSPFFERIYETVVQQIYDFQTESVSEFCMNSTILLANELGLGRDWHISSRIERKFLTDASERVLQLCNLLGARHYITGHGAMNYIDHDLFEKNQVSLEYMDYKLTPYPQVHRPFNPYVSVIDLLFNVGMDAAGYLDSEALYWKVFLSSHPNKTEA